MVCALSACRAVVQRQRQAPARGVGLEAGGVGEQRRRLLQVEPVMFDLPVKKGEPGVIGPVAAWWCRDAAPE